jgi:hypothetical protein
VQLLAQVVAVSKNLKAVVQRQRQLSAISTRLQSAPAPLKELPKNEARLE